MASAIQEHVETHQADDVDADLDDDEYFNDQLTINKIEVGRLVFAGLLDGEEDIVIPLPKSVTSKAKPG